MPPKAVADFGLGGFIFSQIQWGWCQTLCVLASSLGACYLQCLGVPFGERGGSPLETVLTIVRQKQGTRLGFPGCFLMQMKPKHTTLGCFELMCCLDIRYRRYG